MRKLNMQYADEAACDCENGGLEVDHVGKEIEVSANLTFVNETGSPIRSYLFSLNPGFEVTGVTRNGRRAEVFEGTFILSGSKPSTTACTWSFGLLCP
jgi:hypothetical protein